jgi:hypothetical protein
LRIHRAMIEPADIGLCKEPPMLLFSYDQVNRGPLDFGAKKCR